MEITTDPRPKLTKYDLERAHASCGLRPRVGTDLGLGGKSKIMSDSGDVGNLHKKGKWFRETFG